MKPKDIINYQALSRSVTGKPDVIRKNFVPGEHQKKVCEFELAVEEAYKKVFLADPNKNCRL